MCYKAWCEVEFGLVGHLGAYTFCLYPGNGKLSCQKVWSSMRISGMVGSHAIPRARTTAVAAANLIPWWVTISLAWWATWEHTFWIRAT